ncbi:MAG: DUF58 domain-containing protein [Alloprevotella sp.]|nr:DUF58 domain-containing protein [Alloprevotella sp.]
MDELLKKVRNIEIKTRGAVNNLFAGEYHAAFKGRGMSFAEVREYHTGDDVRDIDWNVTARLSRPYVKVFEEERELTVMLLVDVSGSLDFGSGSTSQRELLTEVAATLACSASRNKDKVGVIFFSDHIEKFIPPQKGRRHILRIIRELLEYQPKSRRTDVAAALDELMRVMRRRCIAFVLSDFLCSIEAMRQPLMVAARRHDVVALRMADPRMESLPDVGLLRLRDAETGHEVYVDTSSRSQRQHFAAAAALRSKQWHDLLASLRVDCAEINAETDYVSVLQTLFAKRSRWVS